MTGEEYHHWLVRVVKSHTERRLLIVDSYHQQMSEDSLAMAKDRCNCEVVIIPGGCTSIVQPMDKCINRPFKVTMRQCWEEWMQPEATHQAGCHRLGVTGMGWNRLQGACERLFGVWPGECFGWL